MHLPGHWERLSFIPQWGGGLVGYVVGPKISRCRTVDTSSKSTGEVSSASRYAVGTYVPTRLGLVYNQHESKL